jgi:hypothetical protein
MDKQLLKFLNKEVSVVETMCSIGVERLEASREFVTIKISDLQTESPTYGFWNNPKVHPPKSKDEEVKKPKHTGGKLSYAKIFISEIDKYPKDKFSNEYIGMCVRLTPSVEWDTGMLTTGRGKKKRNMTMADISKALSVSDSTVRRFTKKLEEIGLMKCNVLGYKMTGNLFAKGRSIPCELNLKKE